MSEERTLADRARELYAAYGQRKPMGTSASDSRRPHYFLHRTFLGDQDLLVILNTQRCRYQCHFCQLPAKSSKLPIPADAIVAQFEYVLEELRHSLSVLNRVTLSCEGSVLDTGTFPARALRSIVAAIAELRVTRRILLESRLEFVEVAMLRTLSEAAPRALLDVLTGFETVDARIRDDVLGKREPLDVFLRGLDHVADGKAALTAYVLFKPDPAMTDAEAMEEGEAACDFLIEHCGARDVPLTLRLNPMYAAAGSRWAQLAGGTAGYQPPRLTDVMRLAERAASRAVPVYIGLSTEGLDDGAGTYMAREDYSPALVRPVKLFNDGKIHSFDEWL